MCSRTPCPGRAPRLHSLLIANSPTNSAAYAASRRLLALIQGGTLSGVSTEPICRHLAILEEGLRLRSAEAQAAAAAPGATGASVVQALELEARTLGSLAGTGAKAADGSVDTVPQDAFELACRGSAFRAVATSVGGCNIATAQGRIEALGSGFDGRSVLTARVLMEGSESLAKRHALLEQMRGLKPFVPEYVKYTLTVDPATGTVPLHLLNAYSLRQADGTMAPLLVHLLKFEVLEGNYVDPPYGMLGLKAATEQSVLEKVSPVNHYCQPAILEDLAAFMHTLFVGFGAASASTTGFTMKEWVLRYHKHVKCATGLANDTEKISWLLRGDGWFRASLDLVGVLWKAALHSSMPGSTVWDYVLPFDCEMAKSMDDAEANLRVLHEHRSHFEWLKSDIKPVEAYCLPLLSSAKRKDATADRFGRRTGKGVRGGGDKPNEGTSLQEANDGDLGRAGETEVTPTAPGSLTSTWLYLPSPNDKLLLMAHTVWDTAAEAKHHKVPWGSKCWPVINSGRSEGKLMGMCPCHDKAGHRGLKDAAHVLGDFDRSLASENFTRAAWKEAWEPPTLGRNRRLRGRKAPVVSRSRVHLGNPESTGCSGTS